MDKTFKPSAEWMTAKYAEMNDALFNGSLGECSFEIFTSGKGSQGRTLGFFAITGLGIYIDKRTRRMYKNGFDTIYINRQNFALFCKPVIKLNGNYTGSEHAFLATLAHEMCHYYTYMNGYAPKQGHGVEFREIGEIVSYRSHGMFTIQRLASAEQMSELELSDEMKAKRQSRMDNKKSKVTAIINYTKNGEVELTITSSEDLINEIVSFCAKKEKSKKILRSNDANLIDFLFSRGYKKNFRTYRYWVISDKPWINEINEDNYSFEEIYNGNIDSEVKPQVNREPKRVFSIKTSSGEFTCDANNQMELFKTLKNRFSMMGDETILKLMRNPNNYKMEENKVNTKRIIEGVLNEFMENEFGEKNNDDSIEINPNMNLGLFSPLEIS